MSLVYKALFLDRDGVINIDHGYVYQKKQFEFIDGIFDLCRHVVDCGYMLFVVTNQAGIGRGYYHEKDFMELTSWMCQVFREKGVSIEKVYFCPYHPTYGIGDYLYDSENRKPNPGMLLSAAEEYDIDLSKSVMIGDKASDMEAARRAGVSRRILYRPNNVEDNSIFSDANATVVITALHEAKFLFVHD